MLSPKDASQFMWTALTHLFDDSILPALQVAIHRGDISLPYDA